ncbi:hypothetical protein HMPREF0063_11118 [Aeromicrobium marinum DSM 15272]|uniref:DUF4191 domain-containing protein n=1 Tax=Aeromicrobium marinum DSM 15272 TaxID=585531 RepID=E2SAR0_9ACTN|nr:DUF4191 domain-containing protein [Aeromicrobium marinum]EFQ83456.1 hypothetical protein HMPREF0063_11118 [Aeromicrobium marinum DSM 15272]
MSAGTPEAPTGRIAQMRQAYTITKRTDRTIGLRLLFWFLLVGGIAATVNLVLFGPSIIGIPLAVLFGLLSGTLAALIVFGRRAEKAAYAQVEGQTGAAASALQMLRKGWNVKPAVAFTKQQDIVHRVVGRPGVILVGEGNPHRVRQLLAAEKRKHARIVGDDIPVLDLVVGNEEGQIPLTKLNRHVQKMKKTIKPAAQTSVINKLKALDAMRPAAPMPRGPVPTSMKGARKMMRG